MPKSIINPSLFLRTAFFTDSLKASTGLSGGRIEKIVRANQYEAYGLRAPLVDTVKDYFSHKRSPAVDTQSIDSQSWLIACEVEFPGSSYAFFHPLFDLLLGNIESSVKNVAKAKEIPQEWIQEVIKKGNLGLATEWWDHNKSIKPKRGRPKDIASENHLRFIHLTLMRLRQPAFSILFERKGIAITFARRYQTIEVEIEALIYLKDIDSIAGLVGLVLEAAEIGNMDRFHKAKEALKENLTFLDEIDGCKKISEHIKSLIQDFCLSAHTRRYNKTLNQAFGLPVTWGQRFFNPFPN